MFRAVDVSGPIVLVPGSKLEGQLHRQAKDYPGLPSGIGRIVSDLAERHDGVPLIFREPRQPQGDWSLGLHARTYVVWLFQTRHADAYTIAGVSPLRLRDHDRLARGCLVVRTGWQAVAEHKHIPAGSRTYWQQLWHHWQKLTAQLGERREVPALSAGHAHYLETLDGLIDATQRIAQSQAESAPTYPYRSVESTGERRHVASPVYIFRIVGGLLPERGVFVQVAGEPGQRGQVIRVGDDQVTVRFDLPVAWERLAQQGQLEATLSSIVYDKQREAVALVRTRQARNRTLLPALVDHKVQPLAMVDEEPGDKLDEDQLVAFRRALGVQDMMVVLGPPGTGKTRTISQIARSYALSHERGRVLVASHTNRAVDNVLAKLPKDVTVVRIGNEGKVGPEGRPFLLERQAADLRTEITSRTGRSLRAYQHIDVAARWTEELGQQLVSLSGLTAGLRLAEAELQRARRAFGGPVVSAVDSAAAAVESHESKLSRLLRRIDRLSRRKASAASRATWPLLGRMFGALARSRGKRIAARQAELARLDPVVTAVRKQLRDAENALDDATSQVPEVLAARSGLRSAVRKRDVCRASAEQAAYACRATLARMDISPPVEDLTQLHTWLVDLLPLLTARAKLLQEWHDEVSGAVEQLYPELIRYADVIGATCIGAASRPEISEVTFDVAIVDEAGQIGVTDLLVPLVRAERAVLVGDHRQLPPFVDTELTKWGNTLDGPVRALLTKSALEILVEALPDSHIKLLTQQRRMPAVIAGFISQAFYDGQLKTMVERVHHDPLFSSALAFVDTTRLPDLERAERSARGTKIGIDNPAEAFLLSRLAAFYHGRNAEWALIVPYAAQVKLIRENLRSLVRDSDVIEGNVGTVDSFQGGERDVVLYGFTRSNPGGNVGFLDELRRANVAFTRAKRQLVLVGDMGMLLKARDKRFRELVTALRDHILGHGDVKQYREILSLLTTRERGA